MLLSNAGAKTGALRKSRGGAILFVLLCLTATASAQLPELPGAVSLSGAPTTARFFGGVTADEGVSYGNSFSADQSLDVLTELRVEQGHVGSQGNLYLLILLDGQFFMRDATGAWLPWDVDLATLQASRPTQALAASEPITILNDIAFAQLGLTDVALDIFMVYDSGATPGEFYFNSQPLTLSITPAPSQPQSLSLFQENISAQIIQATCRSCHRVGGTAGGTPLTYVSSSVQGYQETNYNTLLGYIANGGANTLKSKPQGFAHGGGVRLQPGSAALADWIEFVDTAAAE